MVHRQVGQLIVVTENYVCSAPDTPLMNSGVSEALRRCHWQNLAILVLSLFAPGSLRLSPLMLLDPLLLMTSCVSFSPPTEPYLILFRWFLSSWRCLSCSAFLRWFLSLRASYPWYLFIIRDYVSCLCCWILCCSRRAVSLSLLSEPYGPISFCSGDS